MYFIMKGDIKPIWEDTMNRMGGYISFKIYSEKAESMLKGANPMTAADVAEVINFVATAPSNVNINLLELMPVSQAFAPFAINRT